MKVLFKKRVDIYKYTQDSDKLNRALEEYEAFVKELKIPYLDLYVKLLKLVSKIDIDDPQTEEQEKLDDLVTQILMPFADSELPLSLD